MAESILPVLGAWWRSKGARVGDDTTLPAGASTTPYDSAAVPVGSRRFTFEIDHHGTTDARIDLRVNWFNDNKVKINGPFNVATIALPQGQAKVVAEVELPASTAPKWLPSIGVPADSVDVVISSLKIYETPVKAQPVFVWDGASESAATITVWDGVREMPASIEFQA
nr:MAG TPA: Protein of unknown function (DUF1425) [Caudoviricetes sp.]